MTTPDETIEVQAESPAPTEETLPAITQEDVDQLVAAQISVLEGPQTPFEDRATKQFSVNKPVHLGQLQGEIAAVLGRQDLEVAAYQADIDAPISKENPLTIWVTPDDVDGKKVRSAITSHSPDPEFGHSDAKKRRNALLSRLEAGEVLSADETNEALILALGTAAFEPAEGMALPDRTASA